MSDTVIKVENLSKRYVLGGRANPHEGLRHRLEHLARSPWRWMKSGRAAAKADPNEFWALKDISFEIKQGDVVGFIGRNGAGKSTLLKVLSRITEPTAGRIKMHGRVASLLEVGTGFHPELTGRENIFLNGAILGMSRVEIKKKFDEIVAFSEVEKFLDTPVKRYSSGMYVRLAFAVAAHLEPEILIIDEVLAVGDAQFQKKCLGKMGEVARGGRTVLFVSHSMTAVARLCNKAVLLQGGRKIYSGTTHEAIARYNEYNLKPISKKNWTPSDAPGDKTARLLSVSTWSSKMENGIVDILEGFDITVEYEVLNDEIISCPIAAIQVINDNGVIVFASADLKRARPTNSISSKLISATCHVPGKLMAEGRFSVLVALVSYNPNIVYALVADALVLQAVDRTQEIRDESSQDWPGVVKPELQWS
jgi:lipopolysaccharide transport system ATP-binding protein